MNIYDFDNTIYDGDTNKDIIFYSLKRYPINVINSLIKSKILYRKYKKGLIKFSVVKEEMLSFLFKINNLDNYLDKFVNKHMSRIKPWYYDKQSESDVVISASYEIWIKKFCDKLRIKNYIATRTDKSGKIVGENCKGEEKIKRFKEEFKDIEVYYSYSDSYVDIPILEYAKEGYVVEGNKLIKYYKGYNFKR